MRTALSLFVLACAAAPCGAASFSIGGASGYPGQRVSVPVRLNGGFSVTGYDFKVHYDRGIMSFSGANFVKVNGINRYSAKEASNGEIAVEARAETMPPSVGTINAKVVDLNFDIRSSAPPGARGSVRFTGPAHVRISNTSTAIASTGGAGTVAVQVPPTPTPSGPPPEVDLTMASPYTLVPGERPILRYRITLRDRSWEDAPSDAYLGVVPPTGGLLYIGSRGRYYTARNPIVRNFIIDGTDGEIDFGPLPDTYPAGAYTFYGVLARPNMSPLKGSGRITDIAHTRFELVQPTPTPGP